MSFFPSVTHPTSYEEGTKAWIHGVFGLAAGILFAYNLGAWLQVGRTRHLVNTLLYGLVTVYEGIQVHSHLTDETTILGSGM